MNAARQVLRYSIPGSLFLIFLVAFFIGNEFVGTGFSQGLGGLADPLTSVEPSIAIVISLPIGFVLYQLYYNAYKPVVSVPFRWAARLFGEPGGRLVTLDRGALTLSHLTTEQLQVVLEAFGAEHLREAIETPSSVGVYEVSRSLGGKLERRKVIYPVRSASFHLSVTPIPTKGLMTVLVERRRDKPGEPDPALAVPADAGPISYSHVWRQTWLIVRVLRDLTVTKHHPGLKAEHTVLSDLAHSLGASRRALNLGATVGTLAGLINVWPDLGMGWTAAALGISIGAWAWLWWVLFRTRQASLKAGLNALGWGLSAFLSAHPDVIEAVSGSSAGDAAE